MTTSGLAADRAQFSTNRSAISVSHVISRRTTTSGLTVIAAGPYVFEPPSPFRGAARRLYAYHGRCAKAHPTTTALTQLLRAGAEDLTACLCRFGRAGAFNTRRPAELRG